MVAQFTTIGHSNRSLAEFVAMLQEAGVDLLIDVRTFPRSRANPEFNIDRLPDDLERFQIGYRHIPELGGRRSMQVGEERGKSSAATPHVAAPRKGTRRERERQAIRDQQRGHDA